jgi:transcriptional regulator with AAA-type ATPase domain/tetratricopeptide (TPR) repeat protein
VVSDLRALAAQHYQAGNLGTAEQICRQILQADPADVDTLYLLSMVTYRTGRRAEAIALLGEALRARPDLPVIHHNLGLLLAEQGRREDAVRSLRAALRLQPDAAEVHNHLGKILQQLGRWQQAEASYREAVRLRADQAEWHNDLAVTLAEQGQFVEAEASFRAALRLWPEFPQGWHNLGIALAAQHKPDEAQACYEQSLRLRPDCPETLNELGIALVAQAKIDEALACHRKAIALNPSLRYIHSDWLRTLQYSAAYDPEASFAEHLRWAEQVEGRRARDEGRGTKGEGGGTEEASTPEDPRPSPLAPCPSTEGGRHSFEAFFEALGLQFRELGEQLLRVVPQDTTLLLTGETGTGKTCLARLIHELSPRCHEPFLIVDCGALSPSLIESELFGHVKGAFTGADRDRMGKLAAAGKGTLLLDEINALPVVLQGKLLRAVDERTFEPVGGNKVQTLQARIIGASTMSLEDEAAAGRFRADLFYRLNVVSFFLPPLRERRSAVAPLARKFLAEFAARNRPDLHGLAPDVIRALENYAWPGNLRELRNIIERAAALGSGPDLQLIDLPDAIRFGPSNGGGFTVGDISSATTLAQLRADLEIRRITEALRKHGNNHVRAAEELGISRVGLYKKIRKYHMGKRQRDS